MDGLPNHNDNVPTPTDPHGRAAMLLSESLIHTLIAQSVLSVADAIEVVDTAVEVQQDAFDHLGDSHGTIQKTIVLLQAVSRSLSHDLIV